MAAEPRDPAFFIIGSPRSGTTLVQRLCCELDGVVVPPETHYFSLFAKRWPADRFPVEGPEASEFVDDYLALPQLTGRGLDRAALLRATGGVIRSHREFFTILLGFSAPEHDLLGEKTPDHLENWQELAALFPRAKFIGVVRDPRDVVASQIALGWRRGVGGAARTWSAQQRCLLHARSVLGASQVLIVRLNDVVGSPDAARASIATFLGVQEEAVNTIAVDQLHLPWETWKHESVGAIRADARHHPPLRRPERTTIVRICRPEMRRLGMLSVGGSAMLGSVAKAYALGDRARRRVVPSDRP